LREHISQQQFATTFQLSPQKQIYSVTYPDSLHRPGMGLLRHICGRLRGLTERAAREIS
jgi:hypothetical protein